LSDRGTSRRIAIHSRKCRDRVATFWDESHRFHSATPYARQRPRRPRPLLRCNGTDRAGSHRVTTPNWGDSVSHAAARQLRRVHRPRLRRGDRAGSLPHQLGDFIMAAVTAAGSRLDGVNETARILSSLLLIGGRRKLSTGQCFWCCDSVRDTHLDEMVWPVVGSVQSR
jgi:hypothetical protein